MSQALVERKWEGPGSSGFDVPVAVVVPCYKVRDRVLDVIAAVPPDVEWVIAVDDACPDRSGDFIEANCRDPRVRVFRNVRNMGVGGAVLRGYKEAAALGASVIVKIDGDGQMDPRLLGQFIEPIVAGEADYTKGNRFFDLTNIRRMPPLRIFGNAALSFMAKLSTGYWDLFDPTNGYTAIHADIAARLPIERISERYFFETDMLFRLNILRAVVLDVPMDARYAGEVSNLKVSRVVGEFLGKHARNFCKRVFYNYFLRDLSLASIELVAGFFLIVGGLAFGAFAWIKSMQTGVASGAGTVMLAALPVLLGLQLLLAFIGYDIASVPRRPTHRKMRAVVRIGGEKS